MKSSGFNNLLALIYEQDLSVFLLIAAQPKLQESIGEPFCQEAGGIRFFKACCLVEQCAQILKHWRL
jgi:hypothetical protein